MLTLSRFWIMCLSVILWLGGCSSMLDVEPETSVDSDIAIQTPRDVENALVGAYSIMKSNAVYGMNHNLVSELLGAGDEDVFWSGASVDYQNIWNKSQTPVVAPAWTMWISAYEAIDAANVVIAHGDLVANPVDRDRILGEALFVRGISYWFLARFFTPPWTKGDPENLLGLPLELEPTTSVREDIFRPRASLSETYAQILSDLESAEGLLPPTSHRRGRATTFAASAFLSQVYLAQHRYVDAAEAANRVIEESSHALTETYAAAFNNSQDSSEDVFAIQQTATDPVGGLITQYASLPGNVGSANMHILNGHLDRYEEGDDRLELFYVGVGLKAGQPQTGKWAERFSSIPIIRLAEMYLTRAEANLRMGTTIGPHEPLEDLNLIRERVSLEPLGSVTLEAILTERSLELAWEGSTIEDLKRTEGEVVRLGTSFAWDHPILVLPIPQREIDANPQAQQNEGY